ncbi:MAG: GNAT family N-acetyltransferase [Aromatoleum sp.]|nr:GNAT family N-acetyltransferase [Aromatoleum sp.]
MSAASPPVTLGEITAESLSAILALHPGSDRQQFVATNATPIAQAHFEPAAWFRAIYAGDAPVGFAMRYDPSRAANPERADRCFLWRLMIDARQQRNGYGAHAVRLLIAHARALPGVVAMDVSYFPGAGNPGDFYRKLGFRDTGAVDDGEVMLELGLVTHE